MQLTSNANQKGIDRDGALTLLSSILFTLLTAGTSWVWFSYRCFHLMQQLPNHSTADENNFRFGIVFGKQLIANQIDSDYQQRLDQAKIFLEKGNNRQLLLLGGKTGKNTLSEAQAGYNYLAQNNIEKDFKPTSTIQLEEASRNTLENLKQARSTLQSQQSTLSVCLISNRYHLYRCQLLAESLGFTPYLISAEPRFFCTSQQCYKILMEGFYIQWYVVGKFISQTLNNKRMLEKIQ